LWHCHCGGPDGFDPDVLHWGGTRPVSDRDADPTDVYAFGGPHAAGLNVAHGDGSVRLVSSSIDPALWARAGKR